MKQILNHKVLLFLLPLCLDMGLLSRFSFVVRSKLSRVVSSMEDPQEQLDYSYEQMRDELDNIKSALTTVTEQKKRQEIRANNLEDEIEKHNQQARQAVKQGRDDLARQALEKKNEKMTQLETVQNTIAELEQQEEKIIEKKEELQSEVESFRTKKETMKARHSAAEAQASAQEIMSDVGEFSVGQTVDDVENDIQEKEARAEALNELDEEGVLSTTGDSVDEELENLSQTQEVENELSTLKSEVDDEKSDSVNSTVDEETG